VNAPFPRDAVWEDMIARGIDPQAAYQLLGGYGETQHGTTTRTPALTAAQRMFIERFLLNLGEAQAANGMQPPAATGGRP
jgi:hypothetical protein